MGTDIRIRRDPLAMRMRDDQIKQVWGGDPVYPTVNYIQEPDKIIDYRGADFHEPTPNMLAFLKEQVAEIDEAMVRAVDIGENNEEGEDSEAEVQLDEEEVDKKIMHNWSVLKSTPQLRKSKGKNKGRSDVFG